MIKKLLSKTMLLAAIIGAGAVTAWAETVTYTVASTTSVTTSGTAPEGSSATFKNTYSTKEQMTKGNSMTLTLKGYKGQKITNLTLSMSSNKSSGSGNLAYSIDGGSNYTYIIGDDGSGSAFNTNNWYGSWSQNVYVNVSKDVEIIPTESDFIIKINATANSLFCQSFTLTYQSTKKDRSLSFSEPTTTLTVDETVTNAATADPTATVTYKSSDEDVATVDTDGQVTAKKVGSAKITASVAADAEYKEAEASYDLTVNGIPSATGIGINISEIKVGDSDELTALYTAATGATISSVAFSSDKTDVLEIVDVDDTYLYEGKKGGTATVTVTITPSDLTRYAVVSEPIEVTVLNATKGTTELTVLDESADEVVSGSTQYGTNIGLTAMTATGYDGTLTFTTTNAAIADITIDGEDITITPKAVGTATITFTAPATANFEGTVNVDYELTVTAPAAQSTAEVTKAVQVFYESFDKADKVGGNDGEFGNSSADALTDFDNSGWTSTGTIYKANQCVKLGTGSVAGSITTPALSKMESGKTYTLTFKAAAWSKDDKTLNVSITNGTVSPSSFTLSDTEWTEFTATVTGTSTSNITFSKTSKRLFLDEVWLGIPGSAPSIPAVTIAESRYGTYCCEYPLDFSEENENYRAWTVSSVDTETGVVTFERIKGTVKGGVPVILYGEPGTYNLTVATSGTTEPTTLLKGTLAPTYVVGEEADGTKNYGLSGGAFHQISSGTVKANKAYLAVPASAPARLTIVFNEGGTTGIETMNHVQSTMNNEVFDLQGRKVSDGQLSNGKMAKGLYIVNGKKVYINK